MSQFCTNCGASNTDTSRFCAQCGTALPAAAAAPTQPTAPSAPTPQPAPPPPPAQPTSVAPPPPGAHAPPPPPPQFGAPPAGYNPYAPQVGAAPPPRRLSPIMLIGGVLALVLIAAIAGVAVASMLPRENRDEPIRPPGPATPGPVITPGPAVTPQPAITPAPGGTPPPIVTPRPITPGPGTTPPPGTGPTPAPGGQTRRVEVATVALDVPVDWEVREETDTRIRVLSPSGGSLSVSSGRFDGEERWTNASGVQLLRDLTREQNPDTEDCGGDEQTEQVGPTFTTFILCYTAQADSGTRIPIAQFFAFAADDDGRTFYLISVLTRREQFNQIAAEMIDVGFENTTWKLFGGR